MSCKFFQVTLYKDNNIAYVQSWLGGVEHSIDVQ
jgi:hypothetical protein